MSALDLNRVAIAMGKVTLALDSLEPYIFDEDDVIEKKENLFAIAYMCRVGIIEVMEKSENHYMQNMSLPITIPLGIIKHRKETIGSALRLTIGRLYGIVTKCSEMEQYVDEILEGRGLYDLFETQCPTIRQTLFR